MKNKMTGYTAALLTICLVTACSKKEATGSAPAAQPAATAPATTGPAAAAPAATPPVQVAPSAAAPSGNGDVAAKTPRAYYEAVYGALCKRNDEECKVEAFSTIAECVSMFIEEKRSKDFSEFDAAVKAGQISWNEADVPGCLAKHIAQINSVSCPLLLKEAFAPVKGDPTCAALGQGKVAKGGACQIPAECAGDLRCSDGSCVADSDLGH